MTIFYILLAVLMFGIMICVHELGHFLAARLSGIPVKEFAIGFGPQIASWNSKKYDTKFFIRIIPMGGYCMFYGEDDINEKEKDDPRALKNYHPSKRLFTVLMGPIMNILLAFFVAVLVFQLSGVPKIIGSYETTVQSVNSGSPAEAGGMKVGDKILSINGEELSNNLSSIVDRHAEKNGAPLEIIVKRGYGDNVREEKLMIRPLYSSSDRRYMMGIVVNIYAPTEVVKGSFGEVISSAYRLCKGAAGAIMDGFRGLVTRGEGFEELSGIVGVTDAIVKESQKSSYMVYPSMLILISINLGILNLFPFPGLDGSRALFLIYEWIRGKPAKNEAYIHATGMILLFGLLIFITMRDIFRLF